MEYRNLGRSGLKVSALSFGTWVTFGNQIDEATARALMYTAYDAGVNFFDNAEVYANGRSEEVMGRILKESGWPRDTYIVSSKVFWGGDKPTQRGLSRKHIVEACHAALRRLQVDYLDLFFCHRPDRETPLEETVWAMNDLMRQGKILYWGTSEWDAQRITEAHLAARSNHLVPPLMEQPQYNMFHRDRVELEYRHLYDHLGMGTTIWSPLASGLLTGKYNEGIPEGTRVHLPELEWLRKKFSGEETRVLIPKIKQLAELAGDLGATLPQLAIAWCVRNPKVSTAILGASRVEQLRENLKALDVLPALTDEVMERIEAILGNKPQFPVYG